MRQQSLKANLQQHLAQSFCALCHSLNWLLLQVHTEQAAVRLDETCLGFAVGTSLKTGFRHEALRLRCSSFVLGY